MIRPVDTSELDLLISGGHGHPHSVLGPHVHKGSVTVRILRPLASSVAVVHGNTESSPDPRARRCLGG